jgi:hypothetical protein
LRRWPRPAAYNPVQSFAKPYRNLSFHTNGPPRLVDTDRILTTDADYGVIRPLSRHTSFTILPADLPLI